MTNPNFPSTFLWGVATSSHQIEGGFGEGGRGESIWDRFAREPGNIADGSDASVACDHYHQWAGDVSLLRDLGVNAYRFSIAWPRILPEGWGAVNEAGLDFYEALVDELLASGIQPFITLYHWDLPQALQDMGGWGERITAEAFVEYAAIVAERLGDRVRHWITHNEPWCIATLGHENGHHAPGHRDGAEALRVAHHVLLSHGWAARMLRERDATSEIGLVLNLTPGFPASESEADREAVRRFDGQFNRWYLDPVFRGRYPADAIADHVRQGSLAGPELPFVRPGDLEAIATPLTFLGLNYYTRAVLRADAHGDPVAIQVVPEEELTDMGWEVYPDGMYDLLMRLTREYRPRRILVTENGAAYGDRPDPPGRIRDTRRIGYMRAHLQAILRAMSEGAPVGGYFAWSLLDNFEWAHGYKRRFGLYWVDYETQARIPKDSAHWYRGVVAANAIVDAFPRHDLRRVP